MLAHPILLPSLNSSRPSGLQRLLTQAMLVSSAVTLVLPNPDNTKSDLPPGTPWLANNTIAGELLRFHMILGGKVRQGRGRRGERGAVRATRRCLLS